MLKSHEIASFEILKRITTNRNYVMMSRVVSCKHYSMHASQAIITILVRKQFRTRASLRVFEPAHLISGIYRNVRNVSRVLTAEIKALMPALISASTNNWRHFNGWDKTDPTRAVGAGWIHSRDKKNCGALKKQPKHCAGWQNTIQTRALIRWQPLRWFKIILIAYFSGTAYADGFLGLLRNFPRKAQPYSTWASCCE